MRSNCDIKNVLADGWRPCCLLQHLHCAQPIPDLSIAELERQLSDGALTGVDVAVWPYLNHARGAPFDTITVRDLLTMSSALDCNDWERRSPGQEERMYDRRNWRGFALAFPAREHP